MWWLCNWTEGVVVVAAVVVVVVVVVSAAVVVVVVVVITAFGVVKLGALEVAAVVTVGSRLSEDVVVSEYSPSVSTYQGLGRCYSGDML